MTGQNKYGGYSEDPFDAAKAKALALALHHRAHFASISYALNVIKARAEKGEYRAELLGKPWDEPGSYRDEMMMHLRDRGFKVRVVEETENQYAHVQVEW